MSDREKIYELMSRLHEIAFENTQLRPLFYEVLETWTRAINERDKYKREADTLAETLRITQARCTELVEELRLVGGRQQRRSNKSHCKSCGREMYPNEDDDGRLRAGWTGLASTQEHICPDCELP